MQVADVEAALKRVLADGELADVADRCKGEPVILGAVGNSRRTAVTSPR